MNKRAILIPIKDFDSAKLRLSEVLDAAGRAKLAKELARGVIEAVLEFLCGLYAKMTKSSHGVVG